MKRPNRPRKTLSLVGIPASRSYEVELRRALRPMIEQVREAVRRIKSEADLDKLDRALRKRWSDKRIAALVADIGRRAEIAASRPWSRVARGDAKKKRASPFEAAQRNAGQLSDDELIGAIHNLVAITEKGRGRYSQRWLDESFEATRGYAEAARARGLDVPAAAQRLLAEASAPAGAKPYNGAKLVDQWSKAAAEKIKSVRDEVAEGMRKDVVAALKAGKDPAELAARWRATGIPVKFGTLEGRTKVIAQHQLAILHAEVQRERASAVGVTHFIWRTQGDDDVRDAHLELEDETFAYASPPKEGLPGQPVNCRCWAESVIPDALLGGFGVRGVIEADD